MRDEFGTHTENDALRALIAAEIAEHGPITFCRFMELALYHPRLGYYAAREEVIGPRGDYLTSPEISPLFGAMLGRQVAEVWRWLGEPGLFTVVEVGPGNGTLAADLLAWAGRAEPRFREALRYVLVERAAAQEERQRRGLGDAPGVSWAADLPGGVTGCILSNELLDALPVHVVGVHDGRLVEAYVTVGGDSRDFEEAWGEVSTPAIPAYFDALGRLPGAGARAEVNPGAAAWMRAAARALDRGLLLTLDYGYPAAHLYAPWRRQGTLLCFSRHTAHDDPFVRVGRQDITAHVDFTSIARAGMEEGLTLAGFATQRGFLTALGIHDALRLPAGSMPGEEHIARRRAVTELLDPAGLGRVRALALTRAMEGKGLLGFAGTPPAEAELFGEQNGADGRD